MPTFTELILPQLGLLFTSAFALILWLENTLQHWEEKFFNWRMWIPVIYVPVFSLLGLLTSMNHNLKIYYRYSAYGLIIVSLIGLFYHFLHVKKKGLTLMNIAKGRPPMVLPLIYTMLGIFALIVSAAIY